jgi:ABC-type antimicrobial peptide transport system permease subunit
MSSTGFPINDLLRRKFQTSLTIATLTLSVASTLFLLLFSSRLGSGVTSAAGIFTLGLSAVFSQFLLFIGVLIFVIGAVLASFISFLMMAQRTRDFGLMKAAGCPNSLVGGYFMTELLIVSFAGSVLGIALGFLMDYVASNVIFSSYQLPSFWFAPVVFFVFLVLAFIFGLRPIIKAAKMSSVEALSPMNYYGLRMESKHKALSRSALTWRIASRNMVRRQSAILRIVVLLSLVFVLLTISVAGGIIAKDTTTSWLQKSVNSDIIGVAQIGMGDQYKLLLEKFSGAKETGVFNYSDPSLGINKTVIEKLKGLPSVSLVDSRLITKEHVREIANFTIDPNTLATLPVGDSRQGDVIVVGVDLQNLVSEWSIKGRFLSGNLEAVIGDSISQTMYASKDSILADPLVESMEIKYTTFNIVGVCVDPLNNGLVAYVSIDKLENVTEIYCPNLLLIKLNNSSDRNTALIEIRNAVKGIDPNLDVFDLSGVAKQNTSFLASTWQTIMLLPLFTLLSAALCLMGYIMISVDEQHQEFAVLRAVGAKPKVVISILAIQSMIILLSSLGVGLSIGIFITLLILMKQPLVTGGGIIEITGWLIIAVLGMFILSVYPAYRIAKAPILKIMV